MTCNYVTTIKALFFFLQMTSNESLQYAQHFVMSGYCGTNAIYYCKDCSKKLCTDCRFYHNEETDSRYHTVVSFHEENRDEENNADDVNVMATNDIWDGPSGSTFTHIQVYLHPRMFYSYISNEKNIALIYLQL